MKEEFVVYVLYSKEHKKSYVGFTSDLISRFKSHNELSTKGYTVRFRPWEVIYLEFYTEKKAAMLRESFFKTGVGREFIRDYYRRTLIRRGGHRFESCSRY
jgi:putative endonuclease